jgi:hypothetical protein
LATNISFPPFPSPTSTPKLTIHNRLALTSTTPVHDTYLLQRPSLLQIQFLAPIFLLSPALTQYTSSQYSNFGGELDLLVDIGQDV